MYCGKRPAFRHIQCSRVWPRLRQTRLAARFTAHSSPAPAARRLARGPSPLSARALLLPPGPRPHPQSRLEVYIVCVRLSGRVRTLNLQAEQIRGASTKGLHVGTPPTHTQTHVNTPGSAHWPLQGGFLRWISSSAGGSPGAAPGATIAVSTVSAGRGHLYVCEPLPSSSAAAEVAIARGAVQRRVGAGFGGARRSRRWQAAAAGAQRRMCSVQAVLRRALGLVAVGEQRSRVSGEARS